MPGAPQDKEGPMTEETLPAMQSLTSHDRPDFSTTTARRGGEVVRRDRRRGPAA